jgi:hypothetical protein
VRTPLFTSFVPIQRTAIFSVNPAPAVTRFAAVMDGLELRNEPSWA